jgi:hypothetical protein
MSSSSKEAGDRVDDDALTRLRATAVHGSSTKMPACQPL